MKTFYEYLLDASSLTEGTVWELISHPNTGTGGASETIYIEQIQSSIMDDKVTAILEDNVIHSDIISDVITSSISVIDSQTDLLDSTVIVETK